jgi:hypothetical protein
MTAMTMVANGLAAMAAAEHEKALLCFDQAIALEPGNPSHHWHRGIALLALGDYDFGFAAIDGDFQSVNDHAFRSYDIPRWNGEELGERRIAIFHEWGLGDSIMMLRYLPRFETATAIVPSPLAPLARSLGADVCGDKIPIEFFDCYCPMMRLPRYFDGIPLTPYLMPDPTLQQYWRRCLDGKRRMGIAWSGNRKHKRDATRSIALDQFLDLLPAHDCALYSLQNHEQSDAMMRGIAAFEFDSFADVAALASLMDVIVVVDTACANLVGAIGHPNAHVMLDYAMDWRWYRGDDWYPSLHRHRQPRPGNWTSAFAGLRDVVTKALK